MDLTTIFAQKVKSAREKMGLTQDELAYRCGMNSGHLSQIERGKYEPRLETIMRIAKGFGISTAALLDFGDDLDIPEQDEPINKVASDMLMLPTEDRWAIVAMTRALIMERGKQRGKKVEGTPSKIR